MGSEVGMDTKRERALDAWEYKRRKEYALGCQLRAEYMQ